MLCRLHSCKQKNSLQGVCQKKKKKITQHSPPPKSTKQQQKQTKTPQTHSFNYDFFWFICMIIVYLTKQRLLQEWLLHGRTCLFSLPLMTSPSQCFGCGPRYLALATQRLWPWELARRAAGVSYTKCKVRDSDLRYQQQWQRDRGKSGLELEDFGGERFP